MPKKYIGPALETRQYYTIEYWVSKIGPQGHWEEKKSPVILRGSESSSRISIPMYDQSTACYQHWHRR